MPHIVLENINDTKEAYEILTPFVKPTQNGILKFIDKYINAKEESVLLESLSIEDGVNQKFFVQLSPKKSSLTVRLFPLTDPEKTKGVKTIMAMVAKQIKDTNQDITYGKNNLEDFLIH
jgi:hypothetical protein